MNIKTLMGMSSYFLSTLPLFETMVGCLLKYSILSRLDWCFLGGIRQLRANETVFLTWW